MTQEKLDHLLLAFLHEELPWWKRQFVRVRLASNHILRQRLEELAYTSSLIAGSVGTVESVAYHANLGVRRRKAMVTDLAVLGATVAVISSAVAATWSTYLASAHVSSYYPTCAPQSNKDALDCTKPTTATAK